MLNPQTRRVRKVHLTAASEDLIRRGALLLEDALHTASLPDTNGLLLVKSLDVGAIHSDWSSASLALTIEERLRGVVAVHASHPTAHLRDAVYFRDDAEPSILLALRLAQHQSTTGWFWRLAVPAWKPEMSLDDALRTIFFTVTRTKAGLAAAVRLVGKLEKQNALDPLLTAIRPQDGAGLLRAFGWLKPSEMAAAPIEISTRWQTILTRWIAYWGQDDARILWLAGVALAAENPIRLLDDHLMRRAAVVVESVANVRERAQRPTGISFGHRAPLRTAFDEAGVGAGLRPAPTGDNAPEARAQRTAPLQTDMPISQTKGAENFEAAHTTLTPILDDEIEVEAPTAPWSDTPLETQHGGLFFLIPVLARLGIAEFLTPELIEAMFPFHLLRFIGQHLGLPDDDPINAVLATDAAYDPQTNFVAPESWRNGIANPGEPILRRLGDKNVLFDSSGRLALESNPLPQPLPTSWRGENLPIASVSDVDFHLAEGFEHTEMKISRDLLRHTWMTAARRWLRRNAQLGLADLVVRSGRITATRTHIDLFFDLAQADIRVRRVGLDIDPGWVSWLGRVIYFHYREETG
jgi:hypothetical protein